LAGNKDFPVLTGIVHPYRPGWSSFAALSAGQKNKSEQRS
jgi:hypothetical protein